MRPLTYAGVLYLAIIAFSQAVVATAGVGVDLTAMPDWMIYVGLAVICPEDLNRAVRMRIGGERPGDGDST